MSRLEKQSARAAQLKLRILTKPRKSGFWQDIWNPEAKSILLHWLAPLRGNVKQVAWGLGVLVFVVGLGNYLMGLQDMSHNQVAALQSKGPKKPEIRMAVNSIQYSPGEVIPIHIGDTLRVLYRYPDSLYLSLWSQTGTQSKFEAMLQEPSLSLIGTSNWLSTGKAFVVTPGQVPTKIRVITSATHISSDSPNLSDGKISDQKERLVQDFLLNEILLNETPRE